MSHQITFEEACHGYAKATTPDDRRAWREIREQAAIRDRIELSRQLSDALNALARMGEEMRVLKNQNASLSMQNVTLRLAVARQQAVESLEALFS